MNYLTPKNVTLKDIAADTGYSITTVSHALRDMSDISDATKAIVRKRARELGYIANSSASALKSGYSKTIAIIFGDIAHPQHAFMIKELEMKFRENGYSSIIMNTDDNEGIEKGAIEMAIAKRVDGIIICPAARMEFSDNLRYLQDIHIPCVMVNRFHYTYNISWVGEDPYKSGLIVGRYLLQRGHRHILYLDQWPSSLRTMRRKEGFLQALQESDEPVRFKIMDYHEENDFTAYFTSEGKFSYTAIVAGGDFIAWRLLARLPECGLNVPQDVSMVGFGNMHAYLPLPFPLTSVGCSKAVQAQEAVKILLKQIQNPQEPVSKVELEVELHDRGTVRIME